MDKIESDLKFIEMMEKTAADIREGRVHTQEDLGRLIAKKRKRR